MSTALVERGVPDEPTARDDDSARIWSLVNRAAAGDRRAFATLYEIHVSDVFRFVLARTGSHHRADDITSETFVRALSKMTSLTHQRSSFRAWLITIARNIVFESIIASELRRNLRHLSADQRTCLELRFFHGLSLADVARHMKRRPNAVSAIQVRALRTLRRRTSAHWPPPAS